MAYLFLLALSLGDGASSSGPEDVSAVGLPALCLLLIAFSCLPFVRGWPFAAIGAIAHMLLAWGFWLLFHNERMSVTFVLILATPFLVIVTGWFALLRERVGIAKGSS